jgi:hypothetical protein
LLNHPGSTLAFCFVIPALPSKGVESGLQCKDVHTILEAMEFGLLGGLFPESRIHCALLDAIMQLREAHLADADLAALITDPY